MIEVILALSVGLLLGVVPMYAYQGRRHTKIAREVEQIREAVSRPPAPVHVDFGPVQSRLDRQMKALPEQITRSITGTANTHKGKLGELIGYIMMKGSYDRIIPLGNIVDFMAIRFPEEDKPGQVDFIDIKTGKHSRLTPDQRKLKSLLDKKAIGFRTIKVDDVEVKG